MDETFNIGDRIRQRREEAGISLSKLGELTAISKGYLWSLEHGAAKSRPSGETLYEIARALGTTMSDLLGRKLLVDDACPAELPASLVEFADAEQLPSRDIEMLARVNFRGEQPRDPEDWAFVYQAIQRSVGRPAAGGAASPPEADPDVSPPPPQRKPGA